MVNNYIPLSSDTFKILGRGEAFWIFNSSFVKASVTHIIEKIFVQWHAWECSYLILMIKPRGQKISSRNLLLFIKKKNNRKKKKIPRKKREEKEDYDTSSIFRLKFMLDGKLLRQFETRKVFWESVTSWSGGAGKWGEDKNKTHQYYKKKLLLGKFCLGQTKS